MLASSSHLSNQARVQAITHSGTRLTKAMQPLHGWAHKPGPAWIMQGSFGLEEATMRAQSLPIRVVRDTGG